MNHTIEIDLVLALWLDIGSVETFFAIPRNIFPMAVLSGAACSRGKQTISAGRTTVLAVAPPLHP